MASDPSGRLRNVVIVGGLRALSQGQVLWSANGFIHRSNEYGSGPAGVPDTAMPDDFDVVAVSIVDLARQLGA